MVVDDARCLAERGELGEAETVLNAVKGDEHKQALAGARALGVALPGTANAAQLMQACAANGMAELDHSALVRALELMANHEVAKA